MNFQLTFSVQFSQFNEGDSSLESELEIWCPRVRLVMGGEIAFISFEIWLVLSEWRHLHVPCRETFIYFAELCGNITHTAQHLSYHQTPVRTKRIFLTVHTVRVCTVLFCTVLYCTGSRLLDCCSPSREKYANCWQLLRSPGGWAGLGCLTDSPEWYHIMERSVSVSRPDRSVSVIKQENGPCLSCF